MATVNIPSYHEDPNYRYKMPRVRAKIEGRGNGIKTNITNMGEIARALKRPPEYATKFCGCELGSQSKFDLAEGKAIVNGAHTEPDLQLIIDKFVDKFVLCPKCRLPEIDLVVSKRRIRGKCNACGYSGDMDNTHKICASIMKNPPDGGESTLGAGKKKKSREDRQRERAEKAAAGGGSEEDDDETASTKRDKKKKEKEDDGEERRHHHHHHHHHHHKSSKSKDEKSSEDRSRDKERDRERKKKEKSKKDEKDKKDEKEDKKKREKKADRHSTTDELPHIAEKDPVDLSDDSSSEAAVDDEGVQHTSSLRFDSPELGDVIQRLRNYLLQTQFRPEPHSFFQEVRVMQVAQAFDGMIRAYVAFAALFGDDLTVANLKARMNLLSTVCDRSVSSADVLQALEEYVARWCPHSFSHYALICNELYDSDVIDEDTFVARYSSLDAAKDAEEASAISRAKKAAAPFIKWLAEAESASSSEEESSQG